MNRPGALVPGLLFKTEEWRLASEREKRIENREKISCAGIRISGVSPDTKDRNTDILPDLQAAGPLSIISNQIEEQRDQTNIQ